MQTRSILTLAFLLAFATKAQAQATAQPSAQPTAKPTLQLVTAPEQTAPPSLVVVEPEMDLGKIPSTDKQTFIIHLKNQGIAPVTLQQVSAPCGCTAVAPLQTSLAPGQEVAIPVTFDPHGYYSITVRQIDFTSDDSARPKFTWHFKSDVQSPVIPQPKSLGLNLVEGATAERHSAFRFVPGARALKVKSLAFEGKEGVEVLPKVEWHLEHGEVNGTVSISQADFSPELAAKERGKQRQLKLVLRLEDGSFDWIDVYWRLDGFVWLQPDELSLGEFSVGQERKATSFLNWAQPLRNITVKKITATSPELKAEVKPYAASNQQVSIAFTASHPGLFTERVTLEVEAEDTSVLIGGAPAKVRRLVNLSIYGRALAAPGPQPAK